jgi:protocatechuate 3,4-dioxygenase beta subunit
MSGAHPTDALTFLRGIQSTDSAGLVAFRTIFPGFYPGRTNHIHFTVRTNPRSPGRKAAGENVAHVGQIFFAESLTAALMQSAPYDQNSVRRVRQAEDHVFADQRGESSIAVVSAIDSTDPGLGLNAQVLAFVDPMSTPAPVRGGGFGPHDERLPPP